MEKKKGKGDYMPVVIERIIKIEHSESNAFMEKQIKRLEQLKEIERKKMQGKTVETHQIIKELKIAGILDKKGNLASHYRNEE